jgi:hypothetical protein
MKHPETNEELPVTGDRNMRAMLKIFDAVCVMIERYNEKNGTLWHIGDATITHGFYGPHRDEHRCVKFQLVNHPSLPSSELFFMEVSTESTLYNFDEQLAWLTKKDAIMRCEKEGKTYVCCEEPLPVDPEERKGAIAKIIPGIWVPEGFELVRKEQR